jgi:hypothetical protein
MLRILSLKEILHAGILLWLSLLFVGLSSCSDDDDDQDPDIAPTVSFKDLGNNSTVWNIVKATLEVNDDKGVEKVEVYVDGVLLQTLTAAPYEITWDTQHATESTHAIRAVVTDVAGNKSEAEVTVVVKNVLFSSDIAADQLDDEEYGFVILTDDNGNVIASKEYHNGEHIELRSPGFNGETFTVTEILVGTFGGFPISLWTFPQIERGQWAVFDAAPRKLVVTANLSLSNGVAEGGHYRFVTNISSFEVTDPNDVEAIAILPASSKFYVARDNDDPADPDTYALFSSINQGGNGAIDLGQVVQTLSSMTISFPQDAFNSQVDLTGYPVVGDYTESYFLHTVTGTATLKINYPGNAFPLYHCKTHYSTDAFHFTSGRNGTSYNLTPFSYSPGEYTVAGGELNYSVSGDFDYASIWWRRDVAPYNTRWVFILPEGSGKKVALPDLNEALSGMMAAHDAGFDFNEYAPDFTQPNERSAFQEYEIIEGYEGLKTLIRNSDKGLAEMTRTPLNYTTLQFNP